MALRMHIVIISYIILTIFRRKLGTLNSRDLLQYTKNMI